MARELAMTKRALYAGVRDACFDFDTRVPIDGPNGGS